MLSIVCKVNGIGSDGGPLGHWYNTEMLGASLAQITETLLSPMLVAALTVVALVSLLALLVSLRIARRMRAIGDQGEPIADDESIVNRQAVERDR